MTGKGLVRQDGGVGQAQELGSGGPSARDIGFAVVAFLTGLGALAASIGAIVGLVAWGPWSGLVVGLLANVVFWYWVSVGAWRRTIWCPPLSTEPRC